MGGSSFVGQQTDCFPCLTVKLNKLNLSMLTLKWNVQMFKNFKK